MNQYQDGEYLVTEYDDGRVTREINIPAPAVVDKRKTRLEFLDLFTHAELSGIYSAAKTIVDIEIYLDKVKAAEFIDLADPRTIAGVNSLESSGLIAVGRAAEILA